METAVRDVWLQQSNACMKEVTLRSLELWQVAGALQTQSTSSPPETEAVPVPVLLASGLAVRMLCHSPSLWEPQGSAEQCADLLLMG